MEVLVAVENRYDRTPDGAIWSKTGSSFQLWSRYLAAFDSVRVLARVRDVSQREPSSKRADGERVSFAAVPHFLGLWQYFARRGRVRNAVRDALARDQAVILRQGTLSLLLRRELVARAIPYAVEVIGDPQDAFAPGSIRSKLRPYLRWKFRRELQDSCAGAIAALYVTESALQRRYPCPSRMVGVSDVALDASWFLEPRGFARRPGPLTLLNVGTFAQLYKGQDVILDALALCVRHGLDLELVLVGEGVHRDEMERRASVLGLSSRVRFLGELPAGARIRQELDRADIFLLPSRAEGLPRALVEAMARGLPCIASTVGGIPELLPTQDLVPPGDSRALARKIMEVAGSPFRMSLMSAHNVRRARAFQDDILTAKRNAFFELVRAKTELRPRSTRRTFHPEYRARTRTRAPSWDGRAA